MISNLATAFAIALLAATLNGCAGSASEACPHCATAGAAESSNATEIRPASAFTTEWTVPERRKPALQNFTFENQDGIKVLSSDLRGMPAAMSFIYTRCQNQRKCPLVARTMAELQTAIADSNLLPKPRILLVTYDPEFDTPALLKAFGNSHGFRGSENAMLLRPNSQTKQRLIENLDIAVNYNEGGVNLHGVQLILLDKQSRVVRRYHSRLWDNAHVINDLARLAAE